MTDTYPAVGVILGTTIYWLKVCASSRELALEEEQARLDVRKLTADGQHSEAYVVRGTVTLERVP